MLDIIPMLVGIIIMIKGQFQLPGRYITKATGRTIGLLLIAPSAISFCAGGILGAVVGMNSAVITPDGQITINPNDPQITALFNNLITFQLVLLAVALAAVIYLIWRSPATAPPESAIPTQQPRMQMPSTPWGAPPPMQAAKVPDIMSVKEAAAYLRVSEAQILELINIGKLPAARMGGDNYRIARIAIEDYLNGET